ncbi:hypothetical protein [Limosilactobacillus reuteri]|uniref:hypothetical protein n=1 Tax=Limosilactobacillus reuteri TaxID=1598 RepID=UPI00159EFA54|nr:hypothetical protein [Limosilactobacillus reuteri]MCH5378885.1 hypothetical protein [Limosilactobacillus reuteri]
MVENKKKEVEERKKKKKGEEWSKGDKRSNMRVEMQKMKKEERDNVEKKNKKGDR